MQDKWKYKEVEVTEILATEVNANAMSSDEFEKLVANIKKSGLSSTIACYKETESGKYRIISGNHRFKACMKLGYTKVTILYADESKLTRDEIIAVQLSHNSLHGSDDKGILRRLLDEITDLDYKEFSHVEMDDIEVTDMFSGAVVPTSEHYSVSMTLYKNDVDLMQELMEISYEQIANNDIVMLADGTENEDKFLDLISDIKSNFEIKSTSIAFSKILELAKLQLESAQTE